jgi:hypothetical protein
MLIFCSYHNLNVLSEREVGFGSVLTGVCVCLVLMCLFVGIYTAGGASVDISVRISYYCCKPYRILVS